MFSRLPSCFQWLQCTVRRSHKQRYHMWNQCADSRPRGAECSWVELAVAAERTFNRRSLSCFIEEGACDSRSIQALLDLNLKTGKHSRLNLKNHACWSQLSSAERIKITGQPWHEKRMFSRVTGVSSIPTPRSSFRVAMSGVYQVPQCLCG